MSTSQTDNRQLALILCAQLGIPPYIEPVKPFSGAITLTDIIAGLRECGLITNYTSPAITTQLTAKVQAFLRRKQSTKATLGDALSHLIRSGQQR